MGAGHTLYIHGNGTRYTEIVTTATATPSAHSLAVDGLYDTLAEIGYACDFAPEGEANGHEFAHVQASVERLLARDLVYRTSNCAGSTLLVVTEAGWSALADGGYSPPWDDVAEEYHGDPDSFGVGAEL